MKATKNFEDLVKIVAILRKECPWDRRQTHESIKDNLIEEAYEVVDAIDDKNLEELKKELGDLLLHVLFHSTLASETDSFTIEDVIYAIQDKLIRRHPHVFGDEEVNDEQQVAHNWESIKMGEGKKSVLDGIPEHMPALIRAQRMQEKAANIGFDWPSTEPVWDKLEEELQELRDVLVNGDREECRLEFGDLLFSFVNLGRFLKLDAEDSLRLTNKKFDRRFRYVERGLSAEGVTMEEASLDQMDRYWEQSKSDTG